MTISNLQAQRLSYRPRLPRVLQNHGTRVALVEGDATTAADDAEKIAELFPNTYGKPVLTFAASTAAAPPAPIVVGVILSGGQAPGGHNVISGLFDGLQSLNPDNRLIGFLGGPKGLLTEQWQELSATRIDAYRNTGGFDLICSGRDKIESDEDIATAGKVCSKLHIDALVVIGGDDSNTNACVLAESFARQGLKTRVIGCPKTIDGDLKNDCIETSFGFDTACKVYAELIGNIARDALSARKYWHFIRLMGRSASHIALECALQTRPNITLISEEVAAGSLTINDIAAGIADVVQARAAAGKNFGVALIPEGLIEFIPEMKGLISELNRLLHADPAKAAALRRADSAGALGDIGLSAAASATFLALPASIRAQLLIDRDAHGNVQVSRIETEKLLILKVQELLEARHEQGAPKVKFAAHSHFFGYEGRCAPPSNFDANYCYSLGYTAAALIGTGVSGYIASVRGLTRQPADWTAGGVPLTSMMNIEWRHEKDTPVIRKALVELDGRPFSVLAAERDAWARDEAYVFPGPIQYFGPSEVCDQPTATLRLEHEG